MAFQPDLFGLHNCFPCRTVNHYSSSFPVYHFLNNYQNWVLHHFQQPRDSLPVLFFMTFHPFCLLKKPNRMQTDFFEHHSFCLLASSSPNWSWQEKRRKLMMTIYAPSTFHPLLFSPLACPSPKASPLGFFVVKLIDTFAYQLTCPFIVFLFSPFRKVGALGSFLIYDATIRLVDSGASLYQCHSVVIKISTYQCAVPLCLCPASMGRRLSHAAATFLSPDGDRRRCMTNARKFCCVTVCLLSVCQSFTL